MGTANLGKPIKYGWKVLTDRCISQKCHRKQFFRIYTSPDMAYRVTRCDQFILSENEVLCLDGGEDRIFSQVFKEKNVVNILHGKQR